VNGGPRRTQVSVAGQYTNISVFDVDNPGELREILNSLPLYPLMKIEVIALCRHPGALQPVKEVSPSKMIWCGR
jgi:muconolactone delta-isomerase